jgi:hypothetical protein
MVQRPGFPVRGADDYAIVSHGDKPPPAEGYSEQRQVSRRVLLLQVFGRAVLGEEKKSVSAPDHHKLPISLDCRIQRCFRAESVYDLPRGLLIPFISGVVGHLGNTCVLYK